MPPATPDQPLLIDTVILTHWRNGHSYVEEHLKSYFSYHGQLPAISSIVAFEALRGFKRDTAGELGPEQKSKFDSLEGLLRELEVLPFDLPAAQIAAEIFPELVKRVGRKRLNNDLLIAATAIANGKGVATRNKSDFELIESMVPVRLGPFYIAVWK